MYETRKFIVPFILSTTPPKNVLIKETINEVGRQVREWVDNIKPKFVDWDVLRKIKFKQGEYELELTYQIEREKRKEEI